MKKFGNTAIKAKAILSVFRRGERLSGREIVERLKDRGYRANGGNIRMFIYYSMLYKYLTKEVQRGANVYSPI